LVPQEGIAVDNPWIGLEEIKQSMREHDDESFRRYYLGTWANLDHRCETIVGSTRERCPNVAHFRLVLINPERKPAEACGACMLSFFESAPKGMEVVVIRI
jgi:hypothetical protein